MTDSVQAILKRKNITSDKVSETEIKTNNSDVNIRYLSIYSLPTFQNKSDYYHDVVPPPSPRNGFIFEHRLISLPSVLPKLDDLEIPLIREIGVKAFIEFLAKHFELAEYKFNLVQFWFLDIITDCLWKAQDEFLFPTQYQKIILSWILYVFDLIRAPHLNFSRKKIFEIFREAIKIAEEYIESGCRLVPLPEELFSINTEKDVDFVDSLTSTESVSSSASSVSFHSNTSADDSILAIDALENFKFFKLPKKNRMWISDYEAVQSISDHSTDQEDLSDMGEEDLVGEEEVVELTGEEVEFYKPDLRTPPRFLPLSEESLTSWSDYEVPEECTDSSEDFEIITALRGKLEPCPKESDFGVPHANQYNSAMSLGKPSLNSNKSRATTSKHGRSVGKGSGKLVETATLGSIESETKIPSNSKFKSNITMNPTEEKLKEIEVLNALFKYCLWQKRLEDMDDPNVGWVPSAAELKILNSVEENGESDIKKFWSSYMETHKEELREIEKNIFINNCGLKYIKEFIYENFYQSFQLTLLKCAFRYPHHAIAQQLNYTWSVPKAFKGEFKRPISRKPKKKKKEKKPKKSKSDKKKDKKSKSSKKSKKSEKSSKKTKSKSSKSKSPKGSKKEKVKKMTKEEKEELAKLKREEQIRLEQERKDQENKHFMFPLNDAMTDDFFKGIFDKWVRPAKEKKGKDKGKGKKKI